MTTQEFGVGVAGVCFALAALTLAFAVRVIARRARPGTRRMWPVWVEVVTRGALILSLVALGTVVLLIPPPPNLVNQPAPAAADAIVAFVRPVSEDNSENADTVMGVNARTGVTRWTRVIGRNVMTLTRPLSDVILAETYDSWIYALRAADGAVLWSYAVEADYTYPHLVAVDSGRVFAVALCSDTACPIVALDARTGALIWQTVEPMTTLAPEALTAGDGQVFVAGGIVDPSGAILPDQWRVSALGEANGALTWTVSGATSPDSAISSVFVAQGNVILIPDTGPLTALRERDGSFAWRATLGMSADNPPETYAATSDGERVYVMAEPANSMVGRDVASVTPPATLAALDTSSGAIRWRARVSSISDSWALVVSDGVLLSGVSMAGNRADVGYSRTGSLLTAYDAASGQTLWRDNTPPTGVSWDLSQVVTPQGDSGVVYLEGIQYDPSIQGLLTCTPIRCLGVSWLYAVNVHTGEPWWRLNTGHVLLMYFIL